MVGALKIEMSNERFDIDSEIYDGKCYVLPVTSQRVSNRLPVKKNAFSQESVLKDVGKSLMDKS